MASPTRNNSRDNPSYFDFVSDPGEAARLTTQEALETLHEVAAVVYKKTGILPSDDPNVTAGKKRKRRSLREFVSNSLGRSKKKKAKQSCSRERTTSFGPDEENYEESLSSLVRSASLEPGVELDQANHGHRGGAHHSWLRRALSAGKTNSLPATPTSPPHSRPSASLNEGHQQLTVHRSPQHSNIGGDSSATASRAEQPLVLAPPPNRKTRGLAAAGSGSIPLRSMSMSSTQGRRKPALPQQQPESFPFPPRTEMPVYILHKECRRRLLQGEVDDSLWADLVLLHSGRCQVSKDWCSFVQRFFADSYRQTPPVSVQTQEVQAFSRCLVDGASQTLLRIEERTRHAHAQVLVLSPDVLSWLQRWPNIITGRIFEDSKVVVLLLGVTEAEVDSVHRASLLSFPKWRKLIVVPSSQKFIEEMMQEIIELINQGRQDSKPPVNVVLPEREMVVTKPKEAVDEVGEKEPSPPYLTALTTAQQANPMMDGASQVQNMLQKLGEATTQEELDQKLSECAVQRLIPLEVLLALGASLKSNLEQEKDVVNSMKSRNSAMPQMLVNAAKDLEFPMLAEVIAKTADIKGKATEIAPKKEGESQTNARDEFVVASNSKNQGSGYIPMTKNTQTSAPLIRRATSEKTVYVPPQSANLGTNCQVPTEGNNDDSDENMEVSECLKEVGTEMVSCDWKMRINNARPQSRQEILHNLEKHGSDRCGLESDMQKSRSSIPLPTGFTPPTLDQDPSKLQRRFMSLPNQHHVTHRALASSLFESCQGELIDLQDKFKKDLLTLKEVEDKFEQWKKRPDLEVARDRRKEELESMREEWSRLQMLADAKSSRESHLWALLRGLLNRGGSGSSSSGGSSSGSGRKKTASGSSNTTNYSMSSSGVVPLVSGMAESNTDQLVGTNNLSGRSTSRQTPVKDLTDFGPPPAYVVTSKPPPSPSSSPMRVPKSSSGAVPKRAAGGRPSSSGAVAGSAYATPIRLDDYDVPRKLSLDQQCAPFQFCPVREPPERNGVSSETKITILESQGDVVEKRKATYENVIVE